MTYLNRSRWGLGLMALMLLTVGFAGCGSEPAAVATPPAPPPAPPPFQPVAVEVALGTTGGTLTLMTTEAGGFTRSGEAFASGTEVEANGSTYTLTLDGTTWDAAYKQPPAMSLALGSTGGELMIETLEDGSYQVNGDALASGDNVTAANGNMYTVTISDDGTFSAKFVVPAALSIPLGTSGDTVELVKNEDGTYSVNGEVLTADTRVTAANGNVYGARLAPDGTPIGVMHIAAMQEVMLGALGGTITLTQAEDKSWWTGDRAVMDGAAYEAANGNIYVLMMNEAGMWSGMYQADPVSVALGTQGSVTLTRAEDMSWSMGGMAVMDGHEVSSDNGNMYTLSMTDGTWSASFVPMGMAIAGTGLTAYTREGDAMYDVGGSDDTLTDGIGDVTVDGAMYHVWAQDDGMLAGARYAKALHGDSDVPAFAIVGDLKKAEGGTDILPVLSANNEDTVANELRTKLELGDNSFSIADLLSTGMASDMGDNFVAGARAEITKARGDAAALLGLDTAPTGLRGLLDTTWAKAQTQVNIIFGAGKVDLKGRPGDDDLLGELDDILDALSSGPQFAAATEKDGKGVFEDAKLSESDALKAFDAAESEATVVFGMTGATRYGAVSAMERSVATKAPDYATGGNIGNGDTGEMGLVGAFSYSTIDDVQRVWDIQTSGSAYYEGGTRAVSGDGKLYAGNIDLQVRFSSNRVSGLVSNLRSTAGDAWTFQYGEVESIILSPATNLNNTAQWSQADGKEERTARVTFSPLAGSPLPTPVQGTFQGQLLGRGDDSGNQAQGTWSVGEQTAAGSAAYLAGGFGAIRTDDGSPVRPGTDDGAVHETVVTSSDGVADKDLTNTFELDGGNLVVTMNRAGRYLNDKADTKLTNPAGTLDADGKPDPDRIVLGAGKPPGDAVSLTAADDLWILDGDTVTQGLQNVTHELSQSLANLVANPQTDRTVNGPDKQVALAAKAIEAARSDLAVLQGLDTRIPAQEAASWQKVQGALLRIFHHVPPKLAKAYAEDDALGLIDQALDAFSSSNNLASALDRDGRGIFNDVTKADGISEPGAALIWGRQEVQLKTHGGATDYTRWGVWRVRTDNYAASNSFTNFNNGDNNGNEPGSFAYSQLLPTKWADQNDPGFPKGGSAMFVGGTTAIQGTNFLDGDLTVTAEWIGDWNGTDNDPLGTLSMRITDLADADGDPLLDGNGSEFYAIVISAVNINTNSDNEVIFNSASTKPSGVFTALTGTQGLTETKIDDKTSSVMGKFVGQDIEGPLGVIGTYDFDAANFTGAALRGSFGADRP